MVNQWIVGKDDATWDEIFKDNQLVTNGSDIKFLKNYDSSLRSGNKASDEEKYYLKNTRGNSDSAKLDASAGKKVDGYYTETKVTYYTFRTDTSGNVYMRTSSSSGNSGSEVKILSQNQTYTSIHNAKAKEIDNKTYVVRKLLASVERGGGNDSTATWSKKWYNEAMDGITVMVQETKITI
jgi:chitodextrinase